MAPASDEPSYIPHSTFSREILLLIGCAGGIGDFLAVSQDLFRRYSGTTTTTTTNTPIADVIRRAARHGLGNAVSSPSIGWLAGCGKTQKGLEGTY